MRGYESVKFANVASTPATFTLRGGKYGVAAVATFSSGSVDLQTLGPNGSTFLDVGTATKFTSAGYAVIDLPPGVYQFTITTSTAVYASVTRIPND